MKYRKKPVEIEAVQWTGTNAAEVREFMGSDDFVGNPPGGGPPAVRLMTIHSDTAWARIGDWIIREARAGRFYPCKPDVFAASYEPAGTAPPVEALDLAARVRQLEKELGQAVDRSYRDALSGLIGMFHGHARGLQMLRDIGDAGHKISLGDVVRAMQMHIPGNTLGAPDGYVPPAPPSAEEAAAIVAAADRLGTRGSL